MGAFGMDPLPDSFAGFNSHNVDENAFHSIEDSMSDVKHFLMEPKQDNFAVDSFLGLGMENMDISSKMGEFSHGFDFNFLPDYRGLDSCGTQDGEADLKLEILDGFLDEVEHIYASHNTSCNGDRLRPDTQVKEKESELDGDPCRFLNSSSESYSPGISASVGLSEWSKQTVPHAESQNISTEKAKNSLDTTSNDMHCFHEPEDDSKPLSSFIGSWVGRGKSRRKNLRNTSCSRLDSFVRAMTPLSYDFRPRKGPLRSTTEKALSDDQLTSSESEDDIYVTNTSESRSDRRRHQRIWTVDEVVKLVDGISHFGVGKWTDIKNLFFHSASHRTPIDIRDKWRNLIKASCTSKRDDGEAEEKRRSAGRPIPKDIVQRIRELASLQPYSLSKSSCFVHDSSRSRSASRKRKKKRS